MPGATITRSLVALVLLVTQAALGPHLVGHLGDEAHGVALAAPGDAPSFALAYRHSHAHARHDAHGGPESPSVTEPRCDVCLQQLNASPLGLSSAAVSAAPAATLRPAMPRVASPLLASRYTTPSIRGPPTGV